MNRWTTRSSRSAMTRRVAPWQPLDSGSSRAADAMRSGRPPRPGDRNGPRNSTTGGRDGGRPKCRRANKGRRAPRARVYSGTRYCSASATWAALNLRCARKVGNGARDLQHAIVPARAEAESLDARSRAAGGPPASGPAVPPDGAALHLGVDAEAVRAAAVPLSRRGPRYAAAHRGATARRPAARPARPEPARPAPPPVGRCDRAAVRRGGPGSAGPRRRAAAGLEGVARVAARARVHRGDQHEARGEDRGPGGAGDRHRAVFERLAQRLERPTVELRHLVEEQHAVVREADLAGPRERAAADERRRPRSCDGARGTGARRAAPGPGAAGRRPSESTSTSSASSKVSGGRIPGTRRASIVLPAPGRPDQQHVVAAGRSDLERALGEQPDRARRRSPRRRPARART